MKTLFFTIFFLWSQLAIGSGSDTVFVKKIDNFRITDDLSFIKEPIVNKFLKDTGRDIFVIQVHHSYLESVRSLLIDGNKVQIQFGNMEPVEFFYFSQIDLIVGENPDESILILVPCYRSSTPQEIK